jgi:hypothetical protein
LIQHIALALIYNPVAGATGPTPIDKMNQETTVIIRKERGEYRQSFGTGCLLQLFAVFLALITIGLWEQNKEVAFTLGIITAVIFLAGMIRSRRRF